VARLVKKLEEGSILLLPEFCLEENDQQLGNAPERMEGVGQFEAVICAVLIRSGRLFVTCCLAVFKKKEINSMTLIQTPLDLCVHGT
jgi:hypothetical protein